MLLTEHIVVGIMRRSHFKATCTKFNIHIVILYHRNLAVDERHYHSLASEMLVLGVVGVDAHGSVSHDGLRSCGSHYGISVLTHHLVAEIVQLAVFLLIYHLYVAESGLGLGVPVYHTLATIYETFVIEVNEHSDDALVAYVVHSECRAAPVT